MYKIKTVRLTGEECDCSPNQIKHNDGGNYHREIYAVFREFEDGFSECICILDTDTRVFFPNEPQENLVIKRGSWQVVDNDELADMKAEGEIDEYFPMKESDRVYSPVTFFQL